MGAILATQALAHSTHHNHHKAQTHANPLCSLMCAAGQGIHLFEFVSEKPFSPLVAIQQEQLATQPSLFIVDLFHSRAPPLPFLQS